MTRREVFRCCLAPLVGDAPSRPSAVLVVFHIPAGLSPDEVQSIHRQVQRNWRGTPMEQAAVVCVTEGVQVAMSSHPHAKPGTFSLESDFNV